MKKCLFLIVLSSFLISAQAQKTITVHFLYGSVPKKGYQHKEKKRFGGKKGGHVTIQAGDSIIGFQPGGNCHMIPVKNPNGYFKVECSGEWTRDTVGNKYTSIIIPVTDSQYQHISGQLRSYLQQTPYDYAFLGMRCAAATYDILEDIAVVKPKSRPGKWRSFFYPQLLRRKLLQLAEKRQYTVVKHEGVKSRTWEKE